MQVNSLSLASMASIINPVAVRWKPGDLARDYSRCRCRVLGTGVGCGEGTGHLFQAMG